MCAVSCAGGMSLHLCLATLLNCFSNCDCYEYCYESKTYHAACGNADDIFSEEEEWATRCTGVDRQPAYFLVSHFIFFSLFTFVYICIYVYISHIFVSPNACPAGRGLQTQSQSRCLQPTRDSTGPFAPWNKYLLTNMIFWFQRLILRSRNWRKAITQGLLPVTRFFVQVSFGSRMLLGAQAIKVRISHPSRGNVGLLRIEMQISLGKNFNSRMNFRFNFQATCLQDIQFMTRCFTMHCNEHFSHYKIFTFQFLIYFIQIYIWKCKIESTELFSSNII